MIHRPSGGGQRRLPLFLYGGLHKARSASAPRALTMVRARPYGSAAGAGAAGRIRLWGAEGGFLPVSSFHIVTVAPPDT